MIETESAAAFLTDPLGYAPLLRGLLYNGTAAPLVRYLDNSDAAQHLPERMVLTLDASELEGWPDLVSAVDTSGLAFVKIPGTGFYALGSTLEELEGNSRGRGNPVPLSLMQKRDRNSTVRGKIAVVTGAAQGFGFEIAERLVKDGAMVWIADMNLEGASRAAEQLNGSDSAGRAFPVAVNVADETSVAEMVKRVVASLGGIDIFVSNAGVLKAGSVKELSVKDFSFVTSVNYTGYFICTRFVSPVMALQCRLDRYGSFFSDIIQINSKSGLKGSNKNGAYAGGKFGGIGLTQSFALELVTDRIKVNSICPGNFFDGPLWSDPENGLFIQYLRTGKVPGASTIEEVKEFYEGKVPMNRGCFGSDVYKAILYCIEQEYETGQAVPVTGGQEMLH